MATRRRVLAALALALGARGIDASPASAAAPEPGADRLGDWPASADPAEVGTRLARLFLASDPEEPRHYKVACTWYGALSLAATLGDRALLEALAARYAPFRGRHQALLDGPGHVDENVFGIVPLEIALRTGDATARIDGLRIADHQRERIAAHRRFAIDDMFMITALQVQAWRVSRDPRYLDLAADTMVEYLAVLQQDDGLFVHHPDFRHRWARGNGWVAAGMGELLRELPAGHPNRGAIHTGYTRMMRALLAHQIKDGDDAGLWRQVID